MKAKTLPSALITQHILDEFASKNAVGSLNMNELTNSSAEIIYVQLWDKPFNNVKDKKAVFHIGGRFHQKGKTSQTLVITGNKICIGFDFDAAFPFVQGAHL